ncbi:MAG TPA: alkaline phosphatase family protein [Ktedonobacteraceae bacterium]|nr:alkaline phosphatase family protein [Ktedonobacteraceae bacterium]
MLNAPSLNAVNSSRFSQHFVKPLYQSYCFANLPATIQYLLTGLGQSALPADVFSGLPTRYNKVVLLFVDAFGWRFFDQHAENYPMLKMFLQHGAVSKLTSQFPSTTSAHVTCMHTGLNVAQSGVYEWNYYEPLVDALITPLRFSYTGDHKQDTLKATGIPPEAFYPGRTFYQTLQSLGVQSHIFQPAAYTQSTYSSMLFRGTTSLNPFRTLEDALDQLASQVLAKEESPAYYLLYYDAIDATCHLAGPNSQALAEEINYFFTTLEQRLYQKLRRLTGDTLLILTADHGQVEVSPATTFYLNREIPDIARYLRTNRAGAPLVPAGSARDMFLYVKEELLDETINLLQSALAGRAEIYRTGDLIAQNFFGSPTPSNTFLARVGNVVILPYAQETVWWFENGRFAMHFQGHHGGLTPAELEIPLLLLPL